MATPFPVQPVEQQAFEARVKKAQLDGEAFRQACDAAAMNNDAVKILSDHFERKFARETAKWQSTAFVLGVALVMVTIAGLAWAVRAAGCAQ